MKRKHLLFLMLPFLFMCNNNRGSKTPPPLMEIETKKTENNIFLSVSIPLKINNVEYKEHVLKFEYSIQNLSDSTLLIYKPYVEKGFETGIFKTTLTNKNNRNNKFDLIWLKDDGSCDKIKLRPIELTMNNAIVLEKGREYSNTIEINTKKTILNMIPNAVDIYLLQYEINYTLPQFSSKFNYPIYSGKTISNEIEIQLKE